MSADLVYDRLVNLMEWDGGMLGRENPSGLLRKRARPTS